ncbi:hypothetical protein [Thiobacillus denitrificans]|uniref:Lipoprotein n=1 Tax=Thiobacillus denitrificans TaxID=36861 RepID=A0A106BQF7_THIDE|nr:hypothetical protein [Thiobacillus denitrificans]KVW96727.1 hypothetical protein ABW22_07195 [Thiobacillus denitrificans]
MKAIVIGLVLLLGGCAGLGSSDPASPYYVYSSGWTAQLNRPLTIEPGAATVRLQYGRIVPRNGVQEHDPFCVVELNTVSAKPQTLQPGRFDVLRVTRSVSHIAAAPSLFVGVAIGGDFGGPTFLYYMTEFRLRDAAQPDLRGMTCVWDQMAPGNRALMRHLTLDEIQSALGDWMRLIPPEAQR